MHVILGLGISGFHESFEFTPNHLLIHFLSLL